MKLNRYTTIASIGVFSTYSMQAEEYNMLQENNPNIIIIMVDDMGYSDLGCFGGEINTPNIDKLAKEGVKFTQFYNTAKSYPSRASLMTGLYAHQTGVHESTGKLTNCVTVAELLKENGYHTYMTGKWHLGETPYKRGFDKYFGMLSGGSNFFDPSFKDYEYDVPSRKPDACPWGIDDKVLKEYKPEDKNFYTTDAFTDKAIGYIEENINTDKPFFLYLAFNAPHYPLQAWPEDIEKYRDVYLKGWDVIRQERYERMKKLGIIDENLMLSPKDETLRDWKDVENKELEAMKMAVFAAMIDRVDQNIGKLVSKLEELKISENTLILFLSDNGGCASKIAYTPNVMPGPKESFYGTGFEWANVSCTPFRKYKDWSHEGGTSTPLIAYWPGYIKEKGSTTTQVGHIIDIPATVLDIAGVDYPENFKGEAIPPLEGKSLLPILNGKERSGLDALYWEFQGGKAIRKGDWKLVQNLNDDVWALYNIREDRCEMNNLIEKERAIADSLYNEWFNWALYSGVPDFTPVQVFFTPVYSKGEYFQDTKTTMIIQNNTKTAQTIIGNFEADDPLSAFPMEFNLEIPANSEKKLEINLRSNQRLKINQMPPVKMKAKVEIISLHGINKTFSYETSISPDKQHICEKTRKSKIIDGQLDDWDTFSQYFDKPWFSSSSSDNKVWFNCEYDKDFVYMGIKVVDDEVNSETTKLPWEQDGIEIRIDGRDKYTKSNGLGVFDFLDHMVVAMCPGENKEPASLYNPDVMLHWYPDLFPLEGMDFSCKKTAYGYNAEVAMPISYFNERQNGNWESFRINLIIHDQDGNQHSRLAWRPDWREKESFVGSGMFYKK